MRKVVLCDGNNKTVICMEDCVFMKEIKTNVMRILDKEKVEYTHHEYPVDHELDLKKCAKSVGEKSVEMIPVKDITKVTGYVRGGCSPLGMKKQFKTTFHITAESIPKIIVSAGKIGYQIDLKPEDLIRLTNGQCADIIKD